MFSNKQQVVPQGPAAWQGYALSKQQQRQVKGGTDGTNANEFLITEDAVAI